MPPDPHQPGAWIRTLGCVTTTRADYGIYRPLLARLRGERRYEVVRFAGGTHLRREFGNTLDVVQADDFGRIVRVDYLADGDDPAAVAASAGRALEGFGRALAEHPVDLLLLLGDRYEMLSAAAAALVHRIPIAHLHGGDTTAGVYDDSIRHAISKLAALHFPAIEPHAQRLVALGEAPWRICVSGALAIDALASFRPEPAAAVSRAIGLDVARPTLVACVHPETAWEPLATEKFETLAAALRVFDGNVLVIGPNADEGSRGLRRAAEGFAAARPNTRVVGSLSQERFWSCLSRAVALVGNSSSGIIESASLRLPVVNIGRRQEGRLRAANVIDVGWQADEIAAALRRATAPSFRAGLRDLANPYGDGRGAERIVAALAGAAPRAVLLDKSCR